jgi:hypothetical protein
MSSRLEAPMTMTFSSPSTPSISLSSCGHDRALDVGGDPGPAGAEDRVHLVEEDDDRRALAAFSRARWKTSRMCRSVSPTYLLSSSGPLMLRK